MTKSDADEESNELAKKIRKTFPNYPSRSELYQQEEIVVPTLTSIDIDTKNELNIEIQLPRLLTFDEFINSVRNILNAIDFTYSIFALISSESRDTIINFAVSLKKKGLLNEMPMDFVHDFLHSTGVEPLRLVSIHYGSPGSFSFQGVIDALKKLREWVRDVNWKDKADQEESKIRIEKQKFELGAAKMNFLFETLDKLQQSPLPGDTKEILINNLTSRMVVVPLLNTTSNVPALAGSKALAQEKPHKRKTK